MKYFGRLFIWILWDGQWDGQWDGMWDESKNDKIFNQLIKPQRIK